jgi:PAS domain S-box-containing protein
VRPVAWADGAGGYVEAVHATWGNDERGLGPTGSAIRSGRMTVMRDADATFRPWRELARREGFRSVGAVPLHVGDAIFGALVIHAGERNGFDEAESALLMELADDVSYCMTNLRRTEKLAETGAYLSNILQSSTKYSIIGKDLERRIVSWNEGARRNYGYDAEAVIDRDSRFLHTPEDLASGSVDRLFATADATGIAEAEFERVRRDGTRFPATVVLTRRNDTEGRPIGYLLISSDITGKRRAEEEKLRAAAHYVRSLIEASLDPLVTIDADGRITDVNKATETVTGLPRDQLIGHDFSGYFTDPEKARDGYRTAFAAGAVTNYPLAIRHISGRVTDVNYNASTYCDDKGRVIGVFAAARDVTYRKQAEAELAMYQRHLEDLVAARTADLAEANQALDASNHELESFAYSVSHDLRAPLRAIDGYSHILQEDYGEKLDAEAQRLIHVVRDGVAKMARLIDDVLEFSRAARGAIGTSVIDMAGLVQATLQLLAPAMAGRSIAVQVAKLPPMRGDREMIGRVWMNLLDNAIKFTGHRDDALIEVGSYAETGEAEDTVYFVKDNGAGFDMAYVDKLFSVFQRLHGPEDFPGTGAGLAIVKRIVARHGGRAWAEGKIGDGAAFYFAVPPMEPQSGPQAKPEPAHV